MSAPTAGTDNGDGTLTLGAGFTATDNGDGTATLSMPTGWVARDAGDGTQTLIPASAPIASIRASYVQVGDLNLSATEDTGVSWMMSDLTGWGSPASTMAVTQRPTAHGGTPNVAYLTDRVISITGTVAAPTPDLLLDAVDRLAAAVSCDATVLAVCLSGTVRTAVVYRQDEILLGLQDPLWSSFSVQVVAPDPRKYGTAVIASTGLPSSSGGLGFPISFPVEFDAVVTAGTIHIDNPGRVASPVLLRIDGPITGPIVTHIASGVQLVFATSLTLGVGEFITVDMARQEVLAQGQTSRDGYVTVPGFFWLDPGGNDIAFQTAGMWNAAAKLTVTATPAWL